MTFAGEPYIIIRPEGSLRDTNVPFLTNDGGKNWNCQMYGFQERSDHFGRLFCISDSKVINTGYQGEFRFAENNFKRWYFPNAAHRAFMTFYLGIDFFIGKNGVLFTWHHKLGSVFHESEMVYIRSTDYGESWQEYIPLFYDSTGKRVK